LDRINRLLDKVAELKKPRDIYYYYYYYYYYYLHETQKVDVSMLRNNIQLTLVAGTEG